MGRREKQKPKKTESSDDDDAEANEDLSLKIVEKALQSRSSKPIPVPNDASENGDAAASSSLLNEVAATKYDAVIAASEVDNEIRTERKKRSKKKKKVVESEDQSAVVAEEQETVETIISKEENVCAEVAAGTDQTSDNMVLKKLLRGPRYFDPPDSSWGTCYNCGEEGHAAVNCTVASRRKKPCFVCGSLEHGVKQCTKARDCFICKKGGHRAKDCPEKHNVDSTSSPICLKCGNSGHEMFSCKDDYSMDDLKEIQCYVCKRFGHLCCVNTTDATERQFSCYKCGQLGHTGLACSRLRGETNDAATPSSCYKCGEEGHFARECTSSVKPKKKREFSNTKSPRIQKENDYMGYRSAPHDTGKTHQKKRYHTEERENTTPQKSKRRGGWMTEHPGDFSPVKSKRNNWMSPVTPSTEIHSFGSGSHAPNSTSYKFRNAYDGTPEIHSFGSGSHAPNSTSYKFRNAYDGTPEIHSFGSGSHAPNSKSYKFRNAYDGTPDSRGSAEAFHHRYSASRFGNYSGDGSGRNYNWW
ncbi:hypothetical protein RIF29_17689 [Crotalaria pallida]|uniref:CCHC-type domain-containing protein n=1 Tax=Crotalaria pallida TaxID=3830 RepID=A0AAN9IES3_CROPI